MQTIDCAGARLGPKLFIQLYEAATKLAPARFLSLRLHPDRYEELYVMADVPKSIQLGPTPGPLFKTIMRVACIKPPMGVNDGVAVIRDPKADPTKIVFEIHGQPEYVAENLAP